jgi:hypothetical protein
MIYGWMADAVLLLHLAFIVDRITATLDAEGPIDSMHDAFRTPTRGSAVDYQSSGR